MNSKMGVIIGNGTSRQSSKSWMTLFAFHANALKKKKKKKKKKKREKNSDQLYSTTKKKKKKKKKCPE